MTARPLDGTGEGDALDALELALAVEPSPEFVAGVRQRVVSEPIGSRANWRMPLAWSAAAAAVAIVALAWWGGGPGQGPAVSPLRGHARGPATAPATSLPRVPSGPAEPAAAGASFPAAIGRHLAARSPLLPARLAPQPRTVEHAEVLVPADERLALNRLLAAVRAGLALVPPPAPVAADADAGTEDPSAIAIPLMKPIPPLAMTPVDHTGRPDR